MEPVSNIRVLEDYEHYIQASLFTADLHVTRAWHPATDTHSVSPARNPAEVAKTAAAIGDALGEPRDPSAFPDGHQMAGSLRSIVALSELRPVTPFEQLLELPSFPEYDVAPPNPKPFVFPVGLLDPPHGFSLNPVGLYRFVLFTLDLGLAYPYDPQVEESEVLGDAPIPPGFNSIVMKRRPKPARADERGKASLETRDAVFRYDVRVARKEQARPIALIEVEFKPLRIEISVPVCEFCKSCDATVFCPADRAHLCDTCDYNQHAVNKLLRRHRRVPISESTTAGFQWGFSGPTILRKPFTLTEAEPNDVSRQF